MEQVLEAHQNTNLRFYFPQMDDHKRANLASLKFRKEDKWANAVKSIIYGFPAAVLTAAA